jgi:hypothetical protein
VPGTKNVVAVSRRKEYCSHGFKFLVCQLGKFFSETNLKRSASEKKNVIPNRSLARRKGDSGLKKLDN